MYVNWVKGGAPALTQYTVFGHFWKILTLDLRLTEPYC